MVRGWTVLSIGLWCLLSGGEQWVLADRPPHKSSGIYEDEIAQSVDESVSIVPAQDVDETYRLPKTSQPIHYDLQLTTEIHRNERTFTGSVAITLEVLVVTDQIVLHNVGLVISTATISSLPDGVGGTPVVIGAVVPVTDTRVAHLQLTAPRTLQPGFYLLEIEYQGRLSTNDDGFYVSSYVDDQGERRYLATTQFESTSARRAFPCYDEPSLKATFAVTIINGALYGAISNMRSISSEVVGDMRTTKFETTPVMSTYLLAFVVSDFLARIQGTHRVYVRGNAFEEATLALDAGSKILTALDTHLGITYAQYMPKMDQIAIPDFAAGAMENWGLVTYREQYLLFKPDVSTYRTKTNIVTTIAHEFAHQWFGNLVSPAWWEFLWLNEGFATLYEYYATELAYPGEHYWELFTTQVIQAAMVPDGLQSTRPMNWNAGTPAEISALFDRVAYPKSGSVLNMMRHVLGENNWTAGLRSYLNSHALNVATDEDLYEGLQSAIQGQGVLPADVTVRQIMRTWTTEPGYPVLSVRRSYDTGELIISQERFYSDRKVPNTNIWMIPYNFVSQSQPDFTNIDFEWLATKAARFPTTIPPTEWIIFNKQQVGYYRVNYDEQNWQLITNALVTNHNSIHRLNRAQLIDDAYWLARSDRLDLRIMWRLMTYLRNELDYSPWAAADVALTYYNNRLRGTDAYGDFSTFVGILIEEVYGTLAINSVAADETLLDKYLKQAISGWACRLEHEDCLSKTKALLSVEANGGVSVHGDIAAVTYCYGMRTAGEAEFQYLYRKMMNSTNLAERTLLIDSLGCSWNKEYLTALLTTALGNVEINYRTDERQRVIQAVYSGSRIGVDTLIDFLMDEAIIAEFVSTLTGSTLNSALSGIASRTNNAEEHAKLEALIVALGPRISETTATNLRNSAQSNLDWVDGFEGLMVTEFLTEYMKELQTTTTEAPSTITTTEASTTTVSTTTTTVATITTTVASTTTDPGTITTPAPDTTTEEVTSTTAEATTESSTSTSTESVTTTLAPTTTTEGAATIHRVSMAAVLLAIGLRWLQ
ncbi:aminopeptidase N-like [Anopheles bellator]|uniref:aminopeptidase N-like n=1 Tax=Anopheles bellator TaxID=139047 RepID=UPI0026495051|nr:aminopeptidase N-like [Anopheles bellator]